MWLEVLEISQHYKKRTLDTQKKKKIFINVSIKDVVIPFPTKKIDYLPTKKPAIIYWDNQSKMKFSKIM
jgi:hypothetical protein